MTFLSPIFLLALPLVAVPVLIHLFGKRKRQVIRWGAMDFLFAHATPRRRLLRLKDLLLMLVRTALVLAIVCALSQPMVSSSRFGSTGPRDVILVLDNSMSTARKLGTGIAFERELSEAARLLQQLNPADKIRVLLASPKSEWLNDAPLSADASHVRSLLARLRQLQPNDGTADMLDSVQRAIRAEPAGKDFTRFVTVITDGQAHGWHTETPGSWSAIQAVAKKASVLTSVVVAGEQAGAVANLTVEKVTAARAVVGIGQPVTVVAEVRNTGTAPSQETSLTWSTRDQSLGVSTIPALLPGAGTTARLSQLFPTPGVLEISGKLGAHDDLPPDDSSRFLLEVTKAEPILIVIGEPKSDPAESDSQFVLAALGYPGESTNSSSSASAFLPKTIDYQRLASQDLSSFRCVLLADVPGLSANAVQQLLRYVTKGGGLWIVLGGQTDVDAFNRTFFDLGAGLSPLPLGQPVGDAEAREKFISILPPAADHPATALLGDLQRLDIDRVHVYRRHQFAVDNSSSVSVLLRAEGGMPLAIEKSLGRGRIIVQTVPLGLAWSNLPLCHSFVVMVHEWLWYLAEPSLVKRNLQPGEPLQVIGGMDASDGVASLETPDGSSAQILAQEEDGRQVFRFQKTQLPGEYGLTFRGGPQSSGPEKFLVNRDPEESNLTPLAQQQIAALSDAGGLTFGSAPFKQPSARRIRVQPRALAGGLLLGMILLMAAEATIAFWLARERRIPLPALKME